jgi:hypothetical protein
MACQVYWTQERVPGANGPGGTLGRTLLSPYCYIDLVPASIKYANQQHMWVRGGLMSSDDN